MVSCRMCAEKFEDNKYLHLHLRSHKTTQEKYYRKFFPKTDLLTGEEIPFKSAEQYLEQDFVSQNNLRVWLKDNPDKSAAINYIGGILLKKKKEKDLKFAPGQVELRSWSLPSIIFLNKIIGDYYQFCESLGFQKRFELIRRRLDMYNIKEDWIIYTDTREQKPLKFSNLVNSEVKGLKYGDYAARVGKNVLPIRIERKSLTDFIGTFSREVARFEEEIRRAAADNAYLVILVEESLEKCLIFDKFSWINQHTRVTPPFVFHNVRRLIRDYDNIQFLFVPGRTIAAEMVLKLFRLMDCKTIDLQFAYDSILL